MNEKKRMTNIANKFLSYSYGKSLAKRMIVKTNKRKDEKEKGRRKLMYRDRKTISHHPSSIRRTLTIIMNRKNCFSFCGYNTIVRLIIL